MPSLSDIRCHKGFVLIILKICIREVFVLKHHHACKRTCAVLLCYIMMPTIAACKKSAADNTEYSDVPDIHQNSNADKYVSILGDSISTYEGISNAESVNTTIAGYNAYYNGDRKNALSSSDETFWGSVISKHGMNLLVNNSCGGNRLISTSGTGTSVDAGYIRVENLAANTGSLSGTTPDKIFIYMGTNDYIGSVTLGELTEDTYASVISNAGYITPTTFTEAYIITLEKAIVLYPEAQVFVFTLLPNRYKSNWEFLNSYNARIREIAAHYEGIVLVDIAANSGITTDNYTAYTFDGTHPNQAGMTKIAEVLDQAIMDNP